MMRKLTLEQRVARLEKLIKESESKTLKIMNYHKEEVLKSFDFSTVTAQQICDFIKNDLLSIHSLEDLKKKSDDSYISWWDEDRAHDDADDYEYEDEIKCHMSEDSPTYFLTFNNLDTGTLISVGLYVVYSADWSEGEPTYGDYGDLYDTGVSVEVEFDHVSIDTDNDYSYVIDNYVDDNNEDEVRVYNLAKEALELLKKSYPYVD